MSNESKRLLGPAERIGEALFGLIMVLTFTGSLSVADAGRDDVRAMLIGAVGCNIAWGVIDAIFYLMDCLSEQAGRIRWLHTLRKAAAPEDAQRVIAESLPPMVADALGPAEYESIHQKLAGLPEPPLYPRLGKHDWLAALSVFVWFAVTFPVRFPSFMNPWHGRCASRTPSPSFCCSFVATRSGVSRKVSTLAGGPRMVALGSALVAITIALGG
jgi:hypothetical protein